MLWHILITVLAFAGVWACAGALVSTVDRLSSRFGRSHFFVSFFVLGVLTSFSELSVAANATLQQVPGVSVGNLIGATIAIFLLVAPVLAVAGNGVRLEHEFSMRNLFAALAVIAAPALAAMDGALTVAEGWFFVALYAVLALLIRGEGPVDREAQASVRHVRWQDVATLVIATLVIALSGRILVDQAVWFGATLAIPASLFGLLMLSVGTNVPEIGVGIRAVRERKKGVAMGDYVGSAAMNTLIMGGLVLANGGVTLVARQEFVIAGIVTAVGLATFFLFARSKKELTRIEGLVLIALGIAFFLWQVLTA